MTMQGFHMQDDFYSGTVDDAIVLYGSDAPDAVLMTSEYMDWLLEVDEPLDMADAYEPDYYGDMMRSMLRIDVPDCGDEPFFMGSRRAALLGPAAWWYDMRDRTDMKHHRWNGRSNK